MNPSADVLKRKRNFIAPDAISSDFSCQDVTKCPNSIPLSPREDNNNDEFIKEKILRLDLNIDQDYSKNSIDDQAPMTPPTDKSNISHKFLITSILSNSDLSKSTSYASSINLDLDAINIKSNPKSSNHYIPPELWYYIFSMVSAESLLNIAQTCKIFSAVASDNLLWRHKCLLAGIDCDKFEILENNSEVGIKKHSTSISQNDIPSIFPNTFHLLFNQSEKKKIVSWRRVWILQNSTRKSWFSGKHSCTTHRNSHRHGITCIQTEYGVDFYNNRGLDGMSYGKVITGSWDGTIRIWNIIKRINAGKAVIENSQDISHDSVNESIMWESANENDGVNIGDFVELAADATISDESEWSSSFLDNHDRVCGAIPNKTGNGNFELDHVMSLQASGIRYAFST